MSKLLNKLADYKGNVKKKRDMSLWIFQLQTNNKFFLKKVYIYKIIKIISKKICK